MDQSHHSPPQKESNSNLSPVTSSPTNSNRSISPFFFKDDVASWAADGRCVDELPIFALDRSLSPISLQTSVTTYYNTPTTQASYTSDLTFSDQEQKDFISLDQIHELIGTPKEDEQQQQRLQQLETIFEGIFLETPPRQLHPTETGFLRKPKRTIFYDNMENEPPLDENQQD